jgi:GMP synthase (glutamine-hydrolysing)
MACHRRSAIALRHVPLEDLGLSGPTLNAAGWNVTYREAPADDLSDSAIADAELLIVLGGPIGVYDTDAYPGGWKPGMWATLWNCPRTDCRSRL